MRRHLFIPFTILLTLFVTCAGLYLGTSYAQDEIYGMNWAAAYYDNPNLSGAPAISRTEARIDLNFGNNSPGEDVSNDNFSAAFTSSFTFAADTYEFVLRADDGVRLILGDVTVLDRFSGTNGETLTVRRELSGNVTMRLEYREVSGDAFIQFFWRNAPPAPPTPLPSFPQDSLVATVVRAQALSVRAQPFVGADRIAVIRRGERYQIVGRDGDVKWILLDLNGQQGWVWHYYIHVDGNVYSAPIMNTFALSNPPSNDADFTVRTKSVLKLRAIPDISAPQIGRVDWGAVVPVIARSDAGIWYQVIWKNTEGWIYAPYTDPFTGAYDIVPTVMVPFPSPVANPNYDIRLTHTPHTALGTPPTPTAAG